MWLCSDLRAHDWDLESGLWPRVREGFQQQKGVQFHLLAYQDDPKDNLAISVTRVSRRRDEAGASVFLDMRIRGDRGHTSARELPVEIVLNSSRSRVELTLSGPDHRVQGLEFPIDPNTKRGWGMLQLPGDTNPWDNESYFTFAEPPVHRTLIVSDDRQSSEAIRLACQASSDPSITSSARVLSADTFPVADLATQALVVWHAPIPTETLARRLTRFVETGGVILFFPPNEKSEAEIFGTRWGDWIVDDGQARANIVSWQTDADLLSDANSGAALPLGGLSTYRYRSVITKGRVLASYADGEPFLVRTPTDRGAAYFCSTLPRTSHSTMARDGVVLYAMLQRALYIGAAARSSAVQRTAGTQMAEDASDWKLLSQKREPLVPSVYPFHSGAFQNDEQLIALNRHPQEDDEATVDDASLHRVFRGIDYVVVEDRLDPDSMLSSEVWKWFWVAMAGALVAEALLCMPHGNVDPWNPSAT